MSIDCDRSAFSSLRGMVMKMMIWITSEKHN